MIVIFADTFAEGSIIFRANGTGNTIAILEEEFTITDITNFSFTAIALFAFALLEGDIVIFVDSTRVDTFSAIIVSSFLAFAADERIGVDLVETLITDTLAIGLRTTERRTFGSFGFTLSMLHDIALVTHTFIIHWGTVFRAVFDALLLLFPISLIADAGIINILTVGRTGDIGNTFIVLLPETGVTNTDNSVEVGVLSTIYFGWSSGSDDKSNSDTVARVHIESIARSTGTSIVCPVSKLKVRTVILGVGLNELSSSLSRWRSLRFRFGFRSWLVIVGDIRVDCSCLFGSRTREDIGVVA